MEEIKIYKVVEEIYRFLESGYKERIIGYATGDPKDIAEYFRAKSEESIAVTPLEIIAITPEIARDVRQAKQQLQDAKEKLQKMTLPKTSQ